MGDDETAWIRQPGSSADDPVGFVLKAWRLNNKWTQKFVAEVLGVTQQQLSLIENGRRALSMSHRQLIVERLGIPAAELGLATSYGRSHMGGDDLAPEVVGSRVKWRNQRRWLNKYRSKLARVAAGLYPNETRIAGTTLLAGPGWLPSTPLELHSITLSLDEAQHPSALDGSEAETESVRPLSTPTDRFGYYTSAIKYVDPPSLFESRPIYRLLGGTPSNGSMKFGLSSYFDKLDVSEAVAHELAAVCMEDSSIFEYSGRKVLKDLPFRELIGDPFDLERRPVIPAISTLTIRLRRHPADPSFLLHWRDPSRVATAGGLYDVVPAGEFQPSSTALWDRHNDFDLWRNIVREYSEELLGAPEHDGSRSQPIDYDNWPLYSTLQQSLDDGSATAHVLALGQDALTLTPTMLTVVVLDDPAFQKAFGSVVRYNEEGEVVGVGENVADGIPFTEAAVQRMLSDEPLASPAAACLALAWKHRELLF